MDQQSLEQRLAELPLGGIRYFETIGSTNDEAADWAARGAADFSLVLADEQTAGRGRARRTWLTHPGSALAFSLILRPTETEQTSPKITPRFTGLGALGVCRVLQEEYGLPVQIKWPNDVLVNQRKVCGVLAEAQWLGDKLSAVILGIGINITRSALPSSDILNFPATCIEEELGSGVDRIALLQALLAEILSWRQSILTESFIHTWETHLAYRHEWVRVLSAGPAGEGKGQLAIGHILGLDLDGALKIRTHAGEEVTLRTGDLSPEEGQIHLRPVDSSSK